MLVVACDSQYKLEGYDTDNALFCSSTARLTFHSAYALDSVADFDVIVLERHEDAVRRVLAAGPVDLGVAVLPHEHVLALLLLQLAFYLPQSPQCVYGVMHA